MMKFGVIIDSGSHVSAWRHPDVPADAAWCMNHTRNIAAIAEDALFDMIFFADSLAIENPLESTAAPLAEPSKHLEPLMLLASLAMVTSHIGLVSTATTSYHEPYHLARFFSTLDHISKGRAGWNLVTSLNIREAGNFGLANHPPRGDRYERAREFAQVVGALWDGWTDDALTLNKATGQYFDPTKVRSTDHVGKHFEVVGPLNVPRSPQGRPIVTQAGSSEEGRELGAQTADVIFTAQQTLEDGVAFATDVKGRLAKYGRSRDSLKVMPGIVPFIGKTRREAEEKLEALNGLIDPALGLSVLAGLVGNIDLSIHDLDGPLPELPLSNASAARQEMFVTAARRENLTIRQLYERACVANGHRLIFGTPTDIADDLERWYRAGAADGFVLIPAWLPDGLLEFTSAVVPILQSRGLFRSAYEGKTLRENLGLHRPAPLWKVA